MSDYISREQAIDVLKETGIIQDNDLGHLVVDEINRIPTLDEKEIIRKAFERVVERLEEIRETFDDEWLRTLSASAYQGRETIDIVKRILKEECGINE